MSEDNCARLEKIQGGVDLINERLKHANELQNERHNSVLSSIADLHAADAALDGRIVILETDKNVRTGERRGLALSGRVAWTFIGAVPVGIGAAVLRYLGG